MATRKVLIVEDVPDIRKGLAQLLQDAGHRVETAEDGVAGLEAIAWFEPELVLLNLWMPRMDGLTMLENLRQKPPTQVPRVVLMTGDVRPEVFERAMALGAVDVLRYPLRFETFQALVAELLDPKIGDARLVARAYVRNVIDSVDLTLRCGMGWDWAREAVMLLPMDRLSVGQKKELSATLRALAERPHKPSAKGIEPKLIVQALASCIDAR